MNIQKISSFFSKLTIPYYHKGFRHPHKSDYCQFMLEDLFKGIPQNRGFIFAFNNLIGSINHEDFLEFADKICDRPLVQKFEEGLTRIGAQNQKIEVRYDPEIEEEAVLSTIKICVNLNQDEPFYSQIPTYKSGDSEKGYNLYNIFGQSQIKMNILVDVYIKCRTSLKLEGSDCYPYNYHLVQYLLLQEHINPSIKDLFQMMKKGSYERLFVQGNYQWKIVNIDKTIRYQE